MLQLHPHPHPHHPPLILPFNCQIVQTHAHGQTRDKQQPVRQLVIEFWLYIIGIHILKVMIKDCLNTSALCPLNAPYNITHAPRKTSDTSMVSHHPTILFTVKQLVISSHLQLHGEIRLRASQFVLFRSHKHRLENCHGVKGHSLRVTEADRLFPHRHTHADTHKHTHADKHTHTQTHMQTHTHADTQVTCSRQHGGRTYSTL